MANLNNSELLDETLVQPAAKSTKAPQADTTDDLSGWTWPATVSPSQTLPLTQSAGPATPEISSPHTHDETFVHSMLAAKSESKDIAEQLDQTLVHEPDGDNPSPVAASSVVAWSPDHATPLDQTLVHEPEGDDPVVTRSPPVVARSPDRATAKHIEEESDQTLVHAPDDTAGGYRGATKPIEEESDQTLVHAPDDDAPVVTRSPDRATTKHIEEESDQTLVHAPDDDAPDATEATLDAPPVRPTVGPRRDDTRAPAEPDLTQPHSPKPAADPNAATADIEPPSLRKTEPIGTGRPTSGPDAAQTIPAKTARKVPSFQTAGDRYEILGTLGRGGMGVVYKARDKQLNRLVALKMILSGAHASPETLMRFQIEAEAVAKLQHPNIVQIFDSSVRDGHPYFSLEYLDGGALNQKLDGKAQPPKQAAVTIETLARAIHYAHLRGIVHRDMKPANVLLASDGVMKITDFGLAKQLDTEDSGQTGTESILGTPTYMAPEQAAGRTKDVGPAADIYALGVMLYEMLTGRPPFRGNTIMETLQQVQHVEPIQPRRLQPNAPLDLQTICLKCLNKEPIKRYASAEALADDLRAYLENRPIKARPISAPERLAKWMRRQPMQAALVGVCLVAACGLIVGVVNHIREQGIVIDQAEKNAKLEVDLRQAEEGKRIKAEEDKRIIDGQLIKVREAKQEAETNLTLAQSNEKRARGNLDQAKLAVYELTRLAQKSLADRPGLETVRDELLNRVVHFYEEFIKTNQQESLAFDKGLAYRRLGEAQEMLGKNEDAAVSFRQASDSFNTLLAKDANDEKSRLQLAETSLDLWAVLKDLGQLAPSDVALDQAYTLLRKLHDDHPERTDYLSDLAMCENNFGIRAFTGGQLDTAEGHFQKALQTLSGAKQPEDKWPSAMQLERTRALDNLGLLHTDRAATSAKPEEERAKAADYFAQALSSIKLVLKRHPDSSEIAKELGAVHTNRANLLKGRADHREALNVYAEVIPLFDDLGKKYPAVADYRHLKAVNQKNRGDLLVQDRQFDAARDDLTAAVEALGQLVAEFPKRPVYRVDQARAYNSLGVAYEADHQGERARQSWEKAEHLLEPLVREKPQREDYRQELRRTLDYLILFYNRETHELDKAKRWSEATAAISRQIAVRDTISSLFPKDVTNIGKLAEARLALTAMHLTAGDAGEAEKALAEFLKHRKELPANWGKLHQAAVLACAVMELGDRDTNLSPSVRARLREERTEQCLLLLRDAIDQHENIVIGPKDFKTLRDNPDFKELLAEIERKSKKAGEPQ